MKDQLEHEQVLDIVLKSRFLSEVIGKQEFEKLKQAFPDLSSVPVSTVLDHSPDIEDSILNIKSERFLSFRLVTDDEGGSECGPWEVEVYGACGVWVVSSIEYDDLWFSDRDSAIDAAWEYAHEEVIDEIDRGVFEFQKSNSDVDQIKRVHELPFRATPPKSEPVERVLYFYRKRGSSQIYAHNKYGEDSKADLVKFLKAAIDCSEIDITSAMSKANELKWEEAVGALALARDIRKRISNLEYQIESLKRSRSLEIEADDWCRRHGIEMPTLEDFARLAREVKPHFHYREPAAAWDENQPRFFQEAYNRVLEERKKIKVKRTLPEEE